MTYKPSAADVEAAEIAFWEDYRQLKHDATLINSGLEHSKRMFFAGIAHEKEKHAQEMAEVSALVKKAFEITENTECATWNDHYYRKSVVDRFRNAAKKWLEEKVKL